MLITRIEINQIIHLFLYMNVFTDLYNFVVGT
jgi:hypothetical protein